MWPAAAAPHCARFSVLQAFWPQKHTCFSETFPPRGPGGLRSTAGLFFCGCGRNTLSFGVFRSWRQCNATAAALHCACLHPPSRVAGFYGRKNTLSFMDFSAWRSWRHAVHRRTADVYGRRKNTLCFRAFCGWSGGAVVRGQRTAAPHIGVCVGRRAACGCLWPDSKSRCGCHVGERR